VRSSLRSSVRSLHGANESRVPSARSSERSSLRIEEKESSPERWTSRVDQVESGFLHEQLERTKLSIDDFVTQARFGNLDDGSCFLRVRPHSGGQASGLHQVRLNRVSEAWVHKVSIQSWEKSAAFFPRVLEIFSDHDHLYLHTEYLSGRSLGIQIKEHGAFTEGTCRTVFQSVVAALQYIHDLTLLHGSLTSSAVLIGDEEHIRDVRLTSLGWKLELDAGEGGSNPYAAPETERTQALDVYALGVLLLFMGAGHLPDRLDRIRASLCNTEAPTARTGQTESGTSFHVGKSVEHGTSADVSAFLALAPGVRNLVLSLTVSLHTARPTLEMAATHRWVSNTWRTEERESGSSQNNDDTAWTGHASGTLREGEASHALGTLASGKSGFLEDVRKSAIVFPGRRSLVAAERKASAQARAQARASFKTGDEAARRSVVTDKAGAKVTMRVSSHSEQGVEPLDSDHVAQPAERALTVDDGYADVLSPSPSVRDKAVHVIRSMGLTAGPFRVRRDALDHALRRDVSSSDSESEGSDGEVATSRDSQTSHSSRDPAATEIPPWRPPPLVNRSFSSTESSGQVGMLMQKAMAPLSGFALEELQLSPRSMTKIRQQMASTKAQSSSSLLAGAMEPLGSWPPRETVSPCAETAERHKDSEKSKRPVVKRPVAKRRGASEDKPRTRYHTPYDLEKLTPGQLPSMRILLELHEDSTVRLAERKQEKEKEEKRPPTRNLDLFMDPADVYVDYVEPTQSNRLPVYAAEEELRELFGAPVEQSPVTASSWRAPKMKLKQVFMQSGWVRNSLA